MVEFAKTSSVVRRLFFIAMLAIVLLLFEFFIMYFFMNQFLGGFVAAYKTQNTLQEIAGIRDDIENNIKTTHAMLLKDADVNSLAQLIQTRRARTDSVLATLSVAFLGDSPLSDIFDNITIPRKQAAFFDQKTLALLTKPDITILEKQEAETYGLAAEQFRTEVLESLSNASIMLQVRLDQDFETLFETRNLPLYATLLFALLAGIVFYLIALRLAQRINKSLHNLEELTNEVGLGHFTATADILYHDELGQLTSSFNQMTANVRALTVSKTLLEEKNLELEQFSYIASHDLQEPLRKIIAYGEILAEDFTEKLGQDGKENIQIMQDAATRMRELIDSLLVYSRIGRSTEPYSRINLNELVKTVCTDLEIVIKEKSARIDYDNLPVIFGERVQMRQLFQNIISNALKFVKKGATPHVQIDSHKLNSRHAEICISDDGIGFEQKYVERIFLPFRRLHGREEYKGTGIGLAICKKIVERHGGVIHAESVVDKGTKFIFSLPYQ